MRGRMWVFLVMGATIAGSCGRDGGIGFADTARFDTGRFDDTGPDTRVLRISELTHECDDSWWIRVTTTGTAGGVEVEVYETGAEGGGKEVWALERGLFDPFGAWEEWEATRDDSLFACEDEPGLTFRAVLADPEGQDADCVVWGHEPSRWTGDGGCRLR